MNCCDITEIVQYSLSDGGSVTWHEPTPARTTSNTAEVLPAGIVQVYEGSSVTLNWSYSLTLGLSLGVIRFKTDGLVRINADGSASAVKAKFQKRFSASSTPGRASLLISPVTVADDMANGEFTCELIDSNPNSWKRVIQVQVIGKLKTFADYKKGLPYPKYTLRGEH